MNLKFQIIFVIIIKIIDIRSMVLSPCPNIFQYRFDGLKWMGYLTITNPPINEPLNLKVVMSLKGKPVTDFLGEIILLSRGQYLLNTPVLYKINFPLNDIPPKLYQIFVNNQIRCIGEPDQGFFVTVIQLEHTRKYNFFKTQTEKFVNDNFDQINFNVGEREIVHGNKNVEIENNKFRSLQDICGKVDQRISTDLKQMKQLKRGAWPWLAAIYVNNSTSLSYQCGGTLISSKIVISSAHCFQMYNKKFTANEVLIFLGRYNLKNWNEEGSIASSIENIFIHPDYDANLSSYDADIAIIILKNPIRFNSYVRPSCLWSESTKLDYIEGENGMVVGWGDKMHSQSSIVPRRIQTTITSNVMCMKSNEKFRSLISNRTFCAIADNDNDDTNGPCNGDSGVGLMIWRNNHWTLRGIVSAAIDKSNKRDDSYQESSESCYKNQYVIYADISKFLDWIYAFMI